MIAMPRLIATGIGGVSLALLLSMTLPAWANSRLSDRQIRRALQHLPTWSTDGQRLYCTYQFANFVESIEFVNRLVAPAETAGHHPDLTIAYDTVTVSLTTHDVGGLTRLDFQVAGAIASLTDAPCQPISP